MKYLVIFDIRRFLLFAKALFAILRFYEREIFQYIYLSLFLSIFLGILWYELVILHFILCIYIPPRFSQSFSNNIVRGTIFAKQTRGIRRYRRFNAEEGCVMRRCELQDCGSSNSFLHVAREIHFKM